MRKHTLSSLATALVLGGSVPSLPAAAQPAPGVGKATITLACCKCIDGSTQTVNINSGSAPGSVPYLVSGPGAIPQIAHTIVGPINPFWTASLPPAQWIHANNSNGNDNQPGGTYYYDLRIVVPNCVIPMTVTVSGRAAADDQATAKLNGTPIGSTPTTQISSSPPVNAGAGGWGFRQERIFPFSKTFTGAGVFTLRFEVANAPETPTGLLVLGTVRSTCPKKLIKD